MKKLLVIFILCSLTGYSQTDLPDLPNDNGGNPDVGSVPINNGLYVLLAAGLFLGYYKLKK